MAAASVAAVDRPHHGAVDLAARLRARRRGRHRRSQRLAVVPAPSEPSCVCAERVRDRKPDHPVVDQQGGDEAEQPRGDVDDPEEVEVRHAHTVAVRDLQVSAGRRTMAVSRPEEGESGQVGTNQRYADAIDRRAAELSQQTIMRIPPCTIPMQAYRPQPLEWTEKRPPVWAWCRGLTSRPNGSRR